jgi:hypothetical protein
MTCNVGEESVLVFKNIFNGNNVSMFLKITLYVAAVRLPKEKANLKPDATLLNKKTLGMFCVLMITLSF